MKKAYRLLLVDDHLSILQSIKKCLSEVEGLVITGTATTVRGLHTELNTIMPDLLILDHQLPDGNGLDTAIALKKKYPALKILLLSGFPGTGHIAPCKAAGIEGWLHKSASIDAVIAGIFCVCEGGTCYPETQINLPTNTTLTTREFEVLQLIACHKTNEQIAQELIISIYTVETHRKNIMRKLNLKKPGELMAYILRNNI
jgi:DNA-binding NarL/FixJ family response regulator